MITFDTPITRYAIGPNGEMMEWQVIGIQHNSLQIGPAHWVTPAYRSSGTRTGAIENALATLEEAATDARQALARAESRIAQIYELHQTD